MHAYEPASEPVTLDPVYILRDEIAQTYPPVNALERMLVTAVAQATVRLHRAQELERRLSENASPLEVSYDKALKTITRQVADCERARTRSLGELQRAIRNRTNPIGMSPNARWRPGISSHLPTQNTQNEPKKGKSHSSGSTHSQKSANEPKNGKSQNEPGRSRNYNEGSRR